MRDLHGMIDAHVSGGYESTPGNGHGALDDCTTYTFSLCEFCCDWLFQQFKIKPTITDYCHGGEKKKDEWRPASVRVRDDEWRRQKEEFYNEEVRRNFARSKINVIESCVVTALAGGAKETQYVLKK